jgi:hypothetical protein
MPRTERAFETPQGAIDARAETRRHRHGGHAPPCASLDLQPEAARELQVSYELRFGEIVVTPVLTTVRSRPMRAAGRCRSRPRDRRDAPSLLTGELGPREAIKSGRVRITGKLALLERFVEVFHIPPMAAALPA